MKLKSKLLGFTLIELLISMALAIILMAGVMEIVIGNRIIQRADGALARIQETGRMALNLIEADVRAAGFYGCVPPNSNSMVVIANGADIVGGAAFEAGSVAGYENIAGVFNPALPTKLTAGTNVDDMARQGSDVLSVYYTQRDTSINLAADHPQNSTAPLQITDNSTCFEEDDLVVIADCTVATLFRITNTSPAPACDGSPVTFAHAAGPGLNTSAAIAKGYEAGDTWVMRVVESSYFVADTGRVNPAGEAIFSLFRKFGNLNAEELLEGVEFLQLEFGQEVGAGATPNIRYVRPSDGTLVMSQVVSMRVGLLLKSYEAVLDDIDNNTYSLPGENIAATVSVPTPVAHSGGRSLRRVFMENIKVRNRPQN
jgi:type IV pilus assembly protein PilW